jgi:hypothetical protein
MRIKSSARGIIARNIQKGRNPLHERLAKIHAKSEKNNFRKIKANKLTLKFT